MLQKKKSQDMKIMVYKIRPGGGGGKPYLATGLYGPRTESHGPHTGRLLATYSPADGSCGCFQACTSARTRMDLTEHVGYTYEFLRPCGQNTPGRP